MQIPGVSARVSHLILIALLFYVVSNPGTYIFTNGVLGGLLGKLAQYNGAPTTLGIWVHTAVFILALTYLH
jgi:hypothetical protein